MNMIHGTLMVDPSDPSEPSDQGTAQTPSRVPRAERPRAPVGPAPAEAEAERRAEIGDLTRRLVVGAVLTTPVLFAVMAHDLFGADWVPALLLNHWLQFALITPVMVYTGWPIHSRRRRGRQVRVR